MKNNIKKMPGKAEYVIGFIIGNVFFFAYRIALAAGEKWPYVLLLVLSIILYLIWQDSFWMKLAMVVNVLYSIFMLFQHRVNLEYLYERQEQKLVSILLCFLFSLVVLCLLYPEFLYLYLVL